MSTEKENAIPKIPGAKSLEICYYGNPILRAKGKLVGEITEDIKQLSNDMLETMYQNNGVGLAAQQIGKALQITVIDVSEKNPQEPYSQMWIDGAEVSINEWMPMILLNPQVEPATREREISPEGCLSFPDIQGDVARVAKVRVKADLINGKPIEFSANGLLARCIQHETDHLNGILFIDRMNSATKASLAGRLKRMQRG